MKEIYELKGAGRSIREIARELDVSRNTVRRYLKSPEAMRPKARPPRGSKLDPHLEYIDLRMAEGLENCRVLGSGDPRPGLPSSYSTVVLHTCGRGVGVGSRRRRCGLRRRLVSRRRWTGAVPGLHWGRREETPRLGVCDDTGTGREPATWSWCARRTRRLHPVPRECLRVPGRRAPPVHFTLITPSMPRWAGTWRPRPIWNQRMLDFRPGGWVLRPGCASPGVSPDQGQGGERGQVRAAHTCWCQHPFHRQRRPEWEWQGLDGAVVARAGARDDPPGAREMLAE